MYPFGTIDNFLNNDIMLLFINSSCFLYIITHPDLCNEMFSTFHKYSLFNKIKNHELYRKDLDEHYIFTDILPIKIINIDSKYTEILRQLDNLKNMKIQYIKNKFKETFKYCDYAIEECLIQEKFMMTLERMNIYNDELDNIVTTLTFEPIRKHICCISTIASFDLSDKIFTIHVGAWIDFESIYRYIFFQKK
jgi:hypothetical protein